eukprot:1160636-Pelagomonas_calceolata.AAC.3
MQSSIIDLICALPLEAAFCECTKAMSCARYQTKRFLVLVQMIVQSNRVRFVTQCVTCAGTAGDMCWHSW